MGSLAAGCTTSIYRMVVAASGVTNSLSRWLVNDLFRPVVVPHRELAHNREQDWRAKTAPLGPKLALTRSDSSATA